MIIASVPDFREAARRRLPRFLFEYIDGGSYAETTLRRNADDLSEIALRQLVLRDVSQLSLSTELFGQKLALPLALAPIGLAGLNARRGECQALRAAEHAGIPFTLSTVGACPIGEGARAACKPFWSQLYMMLALGAKGVLLGRAWAWALAAQVQPGVAKMLQIIEAEMRGAMALTGCTSVAEINKTILTGEDKR